MPWQVYNSAGQLLQATDLPDNAVTNAKVADDAIGVAELSATGTASSSVFLRGDNAWAAPGGGPSQATQSDIEAETNQDTYIPPDLLKYHPGIAKTWADISQPGTPSVNGCGSYNVASVCDVSIGQTNILHATDMSSVDYARTANTGSLHAYIIGCDTTAALMRVATKNACHAVEDSGDVQVMAFGDFA